MNYLIEKGDDLKNFILTVWESKGILFPKYYIIDKITAMRILKKFSKSKGVSSCYILDKNGIIIASSIEKSTEISIEKKIIQIYRTLLKFANSKSSSLNFHNKIELVTFNVHPDFPNKTSIMILKYIKNGFILLTIIPNKSFLPTILPEYRNTFKKLIKCFKIQKFSH